MTVQTPSPARIPTTEHSGLATAIVFAGPGRLALQDLVLDSASADDVIVDVRWSGVSAGTERLFWTGDMPPFPGMGYPLVPGYEAVGRIIQAGPSSGRRVGEFVFVPGARCFGDVKGLFGAAASRLVTAGHRVYPVPVGLGARAVLLALAATAHHAVEMRLPELIVGHGVLGRLVARLACLRGAPPTVWEANSGRRDEGLGYPVVAPDADVCHGYESVCDVSGDPAVLDALIARIAPRGDIVLAGFYGPRLSFAFPPAFMREAQLRIAAEWTRADMDAVISLVREGQLSLDGLITDVATPGQASQAYTTAFEQPSCLKMVIDWSTLT